MHACYFIAGVINFFAQPGEKKTRTLKFPEGMKIRFENWRDPGIGTRWNLNFLARELFNLLFPQDKREKEKRRGAGNILHQPIEMVLRHYYYSK
jgi:hypothetical protein